MTFEFELTEGHEHIALCDLLKLVGLSESGAAAKHLIAEGGVKVDGVVETRKRCKIKRGQAVTIEGGSVKVG
ncbi:ribosome-associated protein YbcJ [Humisphaera borealis]|uniref:Ribosome-associated protein YbcJ n=1 Tax=Humisphaera borealis TaxID=2807512 RepID=A0A7M2X696_9BACT|nr:ribosome-associated protein YbcJ [Humisphaera borealis]QOV92521.1 ribosome-associated protein YbcJ [Humisphaera borealis]